MGLFPPNFVALFMCLKSNSPLQLYVISQRAPLWHSTCCVVMHIHIHYYLFAFWVCSIFTPKQWVLSFLLKVLLQMRLLPSSSIPDKLKNEEDSTANVAVYLRIIILYHLCSHFLIFSLIYMFKFSQKDVNCKWINTSVVDILKVFNSFHNNLRFTVDKFENEDTHFLDLKIMNSGEINIYVKNTNSGLYINYNSYEPWHTKTAWIRALYDRAHKICNNDNLFHKQVARIKKVTS